MADEEVTTPEAAPKSTGKAKNIIMLVLMATNIVLMAGVGALQFMAYQQQAGEDTVKDLIKAEMRLQLSKQEEEQMEGSGVAQEEDGILFPLEGFTANLAQGDGPRRFLRLSSVLKFSKTSNEEEFKARKPQIRDSIITIINSKRPEDLIKMEGKSYLKEEIKAAINSFLVDGKVIDIYYVGFQIN
jgi:flagellar protein FliL